jgi:hypothetical protein
LTWQDNADNEEGFTIRWTGKRFGRSDDDGDRHVSGGNRESYLLDGLKPGYRYCVRVNAYNQDGPSSATPQECATTERGEETVSVSLARQTPWEGFIPYSAVWGGVGAADSGHLKSITMPGANNRGLYFLKMGRTAADCGSLSSVVPLVGGQTTTPTQLEAIFGVTEPAFGAGQSLVFLACRLGPPGETAPSFVPITLNVVFTGQ